MLNSVMGRPYDLLSNGDSSVARSEQNFLIWCTVDIPVENTEYELLLQGLTGIVKKSAIIAIYDAGTARNGNTSTAPVIGTKTAEIATAIMDKIIAQDSSKIHMQYTVFARPLGLVPDLASTSNDRLNSCKLLIINESQLSVAHRFLTMRQAIEC